MKKEIILNVGSGIDQMRFDPENHEGFKMINDNDILKCKWKQTALIKLLFKDIYDKLIHVDNIHHFKIVNENWEISFDKDGVISVECKNVNRISFFLGDLFYSKNWDLLELNLKYKKENKVFDSSADGR